MSLRMFLFGVLILIMTACAGADVAPTETPTETATSTATATLTATPTIEITPTMTQVLVNTPLAVTVISRNTPIGCQIRTDWSLYTVAQGDTLMRIAIRYNTTVTALTQANCLANPNSILVGQQLRVPAPIATATHTVQAPTRIVTATQTSQVPTPQNDIWITQGSVNISNFIDADAGNFRLKVGETITLRWDNAPDALLNATFYTISMRGTWLEIGKDINPNDGYSISWLVPADLNGHQLLVEGVAANVASYDYARSNVQYIYSVVQDNPCVLNITGNVHVYNEMSEESEILGVLSAGAQLTILDTSADGWVKVQSSYSGWLSPNSQMQYSGVCPALNS